MIEQRGKRVSFCWVPAHVGIRGNELADCLAKEAASSKVPQRCALPFRDFFPYIKLAVQNMWQFCWELEGANKMKAFVEDIHPWSYYPMPRKKETALCRLRIGHTRLTHGFLMCQDPQPYCDDCLVPLTVHHILIECPSLIDLRIRCFNSSRDRNGNFNLRNILGSNFNEIGLFNFLEGAGILHMI